MEHFVSELASANHISMSEIARRSGVGRTTLYRANDNPMSSSLQTLREIAIASGYELDLTVRKLSDPLSAAAARYLLEPGYSASDVSALRPWIERIERYSGDPAEQARFAGHASAPLDRTDGVLLRGQFSAARLSSAGDFAGKRWALSGAPAFASMTGERSDMPTVLYTEQPTLAARSLTGTITSDTDAANLVVLPVDDDLMFDAWMDRKIRIVSPLQAVLDFHGLGAAEQAEHITKDW